jgi:ketosteroid isomerase-like protein
MKKTAILVLIVLCLSGVSSGQAGLAAENEIKTVLDLQKAAWNRGDIERFMATYWKSDALTFQSGNSRTHGWNDVLARYKKNYAPGKMGRLDFTDLSVNVLSREAAYVLGRFKLDLDGTLKEGVFTLILRRTKDGWRIVHDHTSSNENRGTTAS